MSSCRQTSNTVTVKLQLAVLPAASVAVQKTVVVPTGKVEPLTGEQIEVTPGQLSVAVGGGNVTTMPVGGVQVTAITAVTAAGQAIFGGCASLTCTVNEQTPVLPAASVAVQVTVEMPTGKNEPEVGEQVGIAAVQLSTATGAE